MMRITLTRIDLWECCVVGSFELEIVFFGSFLKVFGILGCRSKFHFRIAERDIYQYSQEIG